MGVNLKRKEHTYILPYIQMQTHRASLIFCLKVEKLSFFRNAFVWKTVRAYHLFHKC